MLFYTARQTPFSIETFSNAVLDIMLLGPIENILQSSFRHYNIGKRVAISEIQALTTNCLIEFLACRDGVLQLSPSDFDTRDVVTLIDWIFTC
jgi:hypothetical protein